MTLENPAKGRRDQLKTLMDTLERLEVLKTKHEALETDMSYSTDPDTKTDLEAVKRALVAVRKMRDDSIKELETLADYQDGQQPVVDREAMFDQGQ